MQAWRKARAMRSVGAVAVLLAGRIAAGAAPAAAQVHVTARTVPDSLTVGDRATLEVRVEAPAGLQVRFPKLVGPDDDVVIGPLQVEEPNATTARAAGNKIWIARYPLAVFRTGAVVLPPVPVGTGRDSIATVAQTDSVRFEVQSVLDDSLAAADIRDLKPQAAFPRLVWPWIAAGLAVLALAALVVWWIRRRRRPRAAVVPIARLRPAHEVALEALRVLEAQQLPLDGKFKEHHVRLSDILRRYLEDGFGIAALEETTDEILGELDRHGFDRGTIAAVRALCEESDLVKFAKHEPSVVECVQALNRVRDFVQGTSARSAAAGGATP